MERVQDQAQEPDADAGDDAHRAAPRKDSYEHHAGVAAREGEQHHQARQQEPGVAEAELDAEPRTTLRKILYGISGEAMRDGFLADRPRDSRLLDAMEDPTVLPPWLNEADLDVYVGEFERTGFRGGLNWYRNFDRNWELSAAWQGAKVAIPAFFIGGLKDPVVTMGGDGEGPAVAMLPTVCDDLRGKVLIEGAGHWNQQEKPAETNRALIEFLEQLG